MVAITLLGWNTEVNDLWMFNIFTPSCRPVLFMLDFTFDALIGKESFELVDGFDLSFHVAVCFYDLKVPTG